LLASQEAERKRIAAELHDSLGQNLLVIKNRALLNAMTLPDEPARTQFTELSDAVAQTLDEVRAISHDLRPPHLDQLGLRTALVAMIEKVAASSQVQFTHEIDELEGVFTPGDEILLYCIVQECLNNILKHSGATRAEINLKINDRQFTLNVRDNGRGFVPDGNGQVGLGLPGIAERVRMLGGAQTIQSAPGQGTTVTVRVELNDK
jgi:signal transduction histidine kinase